MRLKTTPAVLSLIILFAICVLPPAHASAQGGVGSGPFNIVVTAGNWDPLIIDVQFTQSGTPVGPLYNVMEEITLGTYKTIGTFTPGSDSNSLEIIYYFNGMTHVYIVPSDWAEKGLELNKSYTMITAIGEPLTYPLFESPVEGDTTITVKVGKATFIDVIRDLPADALDLDAEYPGDTFWVYVNFTAPCDDFNSFSLTDLAPAGWEVETNTSWCSPVASWTMSPYNKAEYAWNGPFGEGTNFSARYKVTIPATAVPGLNEWPNCTPIPCPPCEGSPINNYPVWVEYWFGAEGPYESCIAGESEKVVTVPGCVVGETRDVNGDLLDTVLVVLHESPPGTTPPDSEPEDSDSSSIVINTTVYENCADDTGYYYQNASKYCYKSVDTRLMTDGGDIHAGENPDYPDYIDWSTPEKLAAGFVMNFVGDYGLVCKAASMSYAMESINHYLFTPVDEYGTPQPDWKLSNWKAMQSVASWQFPCGCSCG